MKSIVVVLISAGTVLLVASTSWGTNKQVQQEKPYSFSYTAPKSAQTKTETACKLTIAPNKGWELKTGSNAPPFKAKLTHSVGIKLEKTTFVNTDLTQPDPGTSTKEIATTFTPKATGSHTIDARVTFFVCSNSICKRFKHQATCNVEVE